MFDVLSWLSSDTGLIFAQISNTNIVSEWEMINVDISTIDNYNIVLSVPIKLVSSVGGGVRTGVSTSAVFIMLIYRDNWHGAQHS